MRDKNTKFLLFTLPFFIFGSITLIQAAYFSFSAKRDSTEVKNDILLPAQKQQFLQINNRVLKVEYAETAGQKTQGLSDREFLDSNSGMFFVFSKADNPRPSFWMHKMRFPLDIIWIKDNMVVDISANVPPLEFEANIKNIPRYKPKTDIDSVLEVNAGWAKLNGIKIGDKVSEFNSQ